MATKVNVKFVILLAVALSIMFGGVGVFAYLKLSRTGEHFEAQGDALYAQGEYRDAADMYRRAVGRDRTRIDWLTKWRDALLHVVPETQVEYTKYYREYYMGILGTLATLQDTDPEAQRAHLEPYMRQLVLSRANAEVWQRFVDHVETILQRLPEDDADTKKLYRFRGLALLQRMDQVEEREAARARALEDLQTAFEADPDDIESALGIVRWHLSEWKRAYRLRRTETARQLNNALTTEVENLIELFPDDPRSHHQALRISLERILQTEEEPTQRIQRIRALSGAEEPMLDALADADPASLDPQFLDRVYAALKPLRPTDAGDVMLSIMDRVVGARPNDPELMLMRAELLRDLNRHEDAIAQLQELVEMPDQPVSLKGLLLATQFRLTAMFRQADSALEMHARSQSPQERGELLEQAKSYRASLVDRISGGANSPLVMLLDGKLALAEGRATDAVERLKALDDLSGGRDAQVVELLGRALLENNTLGAARDQYERLVELNPNDVRAKFVLADIERRLRNLEAEATQLEQIVHMAPDFTEARARLLANRAERGVVDAVDTSDLDPVRVALIRWRALLQQDDSDPDEAYEVLEEGRAEYGDDPRILNAMIIHHNQEGDLDEAVRITAEALELHPDSVLFADWDRRFRQIQSGGFSVDERLAMIEESDSDPIDKMIARIAVLENAGRNDEADELFRQAVEAAPEDPRLIEHRFKLALQAERFDEARQLASTAARLNLDSVNGQLYQARIQMIRGETEAARSTLQQVVTRLPYEPLALRLLAQAQLQLSRPTEALESLRRAFQSKPDDLQVSRLYIQTLVQLNRHSEALNVVKRARRFHAADNVLNEMWLTLEELTGDRSTAFAERLKRFESNPSSVPNAAGLIRLLMEESEWAESRRIIDSARSTAPDNAQLAKLDAAWHARQGDIQRGVQTLQEFPFEGGDVERTLQIVEFYLEFDQPGLAIETLQRASAQPDLDDPRISTMLAEVYFRTQRYEQAAELFQEAIDAGGDNESRDAAMRRADALMRIGRHAEARDALSSLEPRIRNGMRAQLMLARAAAGMDDRRAAQRHYDAAVEAAPTSPEPFIQRAQFNASDSSQSQDVMQDLNQALRLDPSSVPARRLKASILSSTGRAAEAIRELDEAVSANPDNRELRLLLIQQLVDMGQDGQAIAAAERAAQRFPNDESWLMTAGDLNARTGRWRQAIGHYRTAHDMNPTPSIALRLAQSYLEVSPARPRDAIATIDQHADSAELRSALLLLKARATEEMNNLADARSLLSDSFNAITTSADMRDWFRSLARFFQTRGEVIRFIKDHTPPQSLQPLYSVQLAQIESMDHQTHPRLITELKELEPHTDDPNVRVDLYRLLGRLLYNTEDYQQSAYIYRTALQLRPRDLEFNNNLAYILARHLDDAENALQPALAAEQISPTDANVLDTVGWIYFLLGRHSQAQAALNRALQNATGPGERLPAYIHLAETLLAEQDLTRARRNAEAAKTILDQHPGLHAQYGDQFEALMQRLNTTE